MRQGVREGGGSEGVREIPLDSTYHGHLMLCLHTLNVPLNFLPMVCSTSTVVYPQNSYCVLPVGT